MKLTRLLILAAMTVTAAPQALANPDDFDLSTVWSDTRLFFTAPVRWDLTDWEIFGGTVAAVAASHALDGTVRDHFAGKSPVLDGKDKHSTRDALPAAALVAGTFAAGVFMENVSARVEAYRMLEAGAFAGITTEALKFAAGRARPNETLRVNDWRAGGSSFPSLHASAAFAIGTVFAESGPDDYRWVRRIIGYGVAGATAYVRLHDNAHWLSDVVAGSAIGIYSGAFTVNRRYPALRNVSIGVSPTEFGGLSVQVTYTPHSAN